MKNYVVDFESFFDKKNGISVVSQGVPNYQKAADAYCLSMVDEDFNGWAGTIAECRKDFTDEFWSDPDNKFWAAYSNFDQGWAAKYFPKTAHDWGCVLDLGAYHQMPRNLAGLAKVVTGAQLDKKIRDDMDGVDFHSLLNVEQERVLRYCLDDSSESMKILKALPPMSSMEEEIAAHTRLVNRRGVHIDTELMEHDKTLLAEMRFAAFRAIPWAASGAGKPLSHPALAKWCNSRGIPVPASRAKGDEECTDIMSDNPALSAIISSMRQFTGANRLLKKLATIQERITDNGTLPLDLMFCGAPHTRRWSSRGVNVQNLDKVPFQVGENKVWIRNWLVPPPGKTFLILDFAQIEPRCLNWLAGNTEMLDAIRAGYSYYEAYATAFKGWRGAKGSIKSSLGLAAYTKLKNESLGCGFGLGAVKYTSYAGVGLEEAKEVVAGFRAANSRITALWGKLDKLVRDAAADRKEHTIELTMPTGELLKHFHVKSNVKIGPDGKQKKGYISFTVQGDFGHTSRQPSLWGGVLTENITQRMARDILAEAVVKLEKAGLQVSFTSHDEVILAVDNDNKGEAKQEAERIMSTPPEWCSDLPLGADGDFSDRYTKL